MKEEKQEIKLELINFSTNENVTYKGNFSKPEYDILYETISLLIGPEMYCNNKFRKIIQNYINSLL